MPIFVSCYYSANWPITPEVVTSRAATSWPLPGRGQDAAGPRHGQGQGQGAVTPLRHQDGGTRGICLSLL